MFFARCSERFDQAAQSARRNVVIPMLFVMIGAAVAYLFIAVRGKDDIAGGVAMGLAMIFVSVVIATAAAVFEKLFQNAVDIKSENDLTV